LGLSHSETANSLNDLGLLYKVQGKHAQAEPLYVRALTIYEQELGPHHPDTARRDASELRTRVWVTTFGRGVGT